MPLRTLHASLASCGVSARDRAGTSRGCIGLALLLVIILSAPSLAVLTAPVGGSAVPTVFISEDTVVRTSENVNGYGIYDGEDCTVTIDMASGLYSGTVSFGYYNEASMTYLPFVAVTVSGADDIQLVYSVESGGSAGTLRISGVSEGDADIGRIAVETGDVVFGAGPDGSCSGTVAVRSAELILDGAHDVRVSAGVPDAVLSSEGLGGTVTVGGTASVGDMTIDQDGILAVAPGATVNLGGAAGRTYSISTTYSAYGSETVSDYDLKDITGTDITEGHCTVGGGNTLIYDVVPGVYTLTLRFSDGYLHISDAAVSPDGAFCMLPRNSVLTSEGTARSLFGLRLGLPSDSTAEVTLDGPDGDAGYIQDGSDVYIYGLDDDTTYGIEVTQGGASYVTDVTIDGDGFTGDDSEGNTLEVGCFIHFYYSLSEIRTDYAYLSGHDVGIHGALALYGVSRGSVSVFFMIGIGDTYRIDVDMEATEYVGHLEIPSSSPDSSTVHYTLSCDSVEPVTGGEAQASEEHSETTVNVVGTLDNRGTLLVTGHSSFSLSDGSGLTGAEGASVTIDDDAECSFTGSPDVIFRPGFEPGHFVYDGVITAEKTYSLWSTPYTVTVDPKGGTGSGAGWALVDGCYEKEFTCGSVISLLSLSRPGFSFSGWDPPDVDGSVITCDTGAAAAWKDVYVITASAGTGGGIDPEGSVRVVQGHSVSFSVTPDPGYLISDVRVDGSSVGAVSSYTFSDVEADHTIAASFAGTGVTYTIHAEAGPGGYVTPSGDVTVPAGGSQTFTVSPDSGYRTDRVLVDGGEVTLSEEGTYTFEGVSADHIISASFTAAGGGDTMLLLYAALIVGAIVAAGAVILILSRSRNRG